MQVIFTPFAERQIDALHAYIADHSSENLAEGYVRRIAFAVVNDVILIEGVFYGGRDFEALFREGKTPS